ncbi:MAG: nitrilase [Firmicutes bacterium]|nr:nitrilase [Bacillota bacterium]
MALDGWKERLLRRYLYWRCRPAKVKRRLSALVKERTAPPVVEAGCLNVAALQVQVQLFRDPLDYVDTMHRLVKEAAAKGAHLVAFPEYNNLALLVMLPGIEQMGEGASGGAMEAEANTNGPAITVTDVVSYIGPVMAPFLDTLYSSLAAAYGLYLMAGSFLLPDKDRVVNRAFLYGPHGQLLGTQDKVHLMPMEAEWGTSAGTRLNLFDTELGKIAAPVCMDATYFETFRILELKGAEIIIIPIANPEPYNHWLALRGIWSRVQECPTYGVKSALVGRLLGFEFTGRAGIFGPAELTLGGSGILDIVTSPKDEGMAFAQIDLTALKELRRDHPWRDSNPQLYRRYFPRVYQSIE